MALERIQVLSGLRGVLSKPVSLKSWWELLGVPLLLVHLLVLHLLLILPPPPLLPSIQQRQQRPLCAASLKTSMNAPSMHPSSSFCHLSSSVQAESWRHQDCAQCRGGNGREKSRHFGWNRSSSWRRCPTICSATRRTNCWPPRARGSL